MNTSLYRPMRDFDSLMERLGWPLDKEGGLQTMTRADWCPSVDISESDKEYLIKVEIPEVRKEDIKIQVNNGMLSISGERQQEKEDQKHHRVERYYGTFSRSFSLPDNVKEEGIEAEQKDGMLYLHLKKAKASKPRTLDIKVS